MKDCDCLSILIPAVLLSLCTLSSCVFFFFSFFKIIITSRLDWSFRFHSVNYGITWGPNWQILYWMNEWINVNIEACIFVFVSVKYNDKNSCSFFFPFDFISPLPPLWGFLSPSESNSKRKKKRQTISSLFFPWIKWKVKNKMLPYTCIFWHSCHCIEKVPKAFKRPSKDWKLKRFKCYEYKTPPSIAFVWIFWI